MQALLKYAHPATQWSHIIFNHFCQNLVTLISTIMAHEGHLSRGGTHHNASNPTFFKST